MLSIEIPKILGRFNGCKETFLPNRVYAVVGPNGSGKTTFLKVIGGILETNAHIVWQGRCVSENLKTWTKTLAYSPGEAIFSMGITVEEALWMGLENLGLTYEKTISEETLQQFHLLNRRQDLFRNLSGGETQRFLLAKVYLRKPKIFLLDESFSKMDWAHSLEFLPKLRKWAQDCGMVFWVTHDERLALGFSDEIMGLSRGELILRRNTAELIKNRSLSQKHEAWNLEAMTWFPELFDTHNPKKFEDPPNRHLNQSLGLE